MKKQFVSPACAVIVIESEDVLTTSSTPSVINLDEFGFYDDSKTNLPGISQ